MCLFLVIVSGRVFANNDRIVLFQETVIQRWDSFLTSMKQDDGVVGERLLKNEVIAEYALGTAKSEKWIPEDIGDDAFKAKFRHINGLSGPLIDKEVFRKQAREGKVLVPTFESTEVNKQQPLPLIRFVGASDQTDRLEREVAELRKQLAQARIDVRNGDAQVATLAGERLQKLDQQLTGIKEQLEKLPSTAEVAKLSKEVASVSALLTEIPGLKQTQAEQATSISKLWLTIGGVGALGAFALLLALIGNLRVSKTRAIAEVAKTEATEAKTSALALHNDVAELGSRVGAVERDVYKILFNTEAVEASAVDAMRIGAVLDLDIRSTESGEVITTLKIVRTQTGVDIHGIKRSIDHRDNFTSYPVADLATVIRRAFKQGRMFGVSTPSTARLVAVS